MGAESLVEIYRTQENKAKFEFKSVVTITYFGDSATLQGMSGTFNRNCWREIKLHLLKRGINRAMYIRRGKLVVIDRNPCPLHQDGQV